MKLIIDDKIFELFPEVMLALIVLEGADNLGHPEEIKEKICQEEDFCRQMFKDMKLPDHPNIKCWRQAYTKFGAGSKYRSSVEALTKRVVKGGKIPVINKLVDLYNLISLKYLVPVGGEDLREIKGDIYLTLATGEERFIELGTCDNDPPQKNEVVYKDDNNEVLCRRWNWREANKTKLTDKTKRAIIVCEGLPPINAIELKEAAIELSELIKKYCGGKNKLFLLNKNYRSTSLALL